MTTLAVIESEHGVSIGFDSQVTLGDTCDELTYPKVFASGEVILGVCGTLRMANQLRYVDFPQPEPDDWDIDKFVSLEIIPAIADALPHRNSDSEEGIGGGLLVIVRGRVYELGNDLAWKRYASGIYCSGSGWQFALGALATGATLREALGVASKYDIHTGGRLYVKQAAELIEQEGSAA